MSGKRQHFLPRFLKKGFASRIKKQEIYSWVFSKGNKPYETNLRNVGLEHFFYGKEDESQADKLITEAENKFIGVVEKLRALETSQHIIDMLVPELVVHLIVRNKHFRSSMKGGGQALAGIVSENLQSPDDFYNFILAISRGRNFKDILRRNIKEKATGNLQNEQIEKHTELLMQKLPEIARSNNSEGLNTFKILFQKLYDEMPSIVKDSHNKVLSEEATPSAFIKKMDGFKWHIYVAPKGRFLLGDIGPMCNFGLDGDFKPYIFSGGKVQQFLLPISTTHLIIGSICDKFEVPDINTINLASVSLSQNYFISAKNTHLEQNLLAEIGSNNTNLNNQENLDIQNKFKKDFFSKED